MNQIAQLKNITKNYRVGKLDYQALHQFDIQVSAGEFVTLVGPSGCGKSTALNIIGCMDTPTDGEISIFGYPVLEVSDNVLSQIRRERIGFIFQNFNLLSVLTVLENIMYPLNLNRKPNARAIAMEMIEKVGLQDFIKMKPNELSGGQRQRCAVARAFAGSPELIIADEPTANLDSKNSEQIIESILQLSAEQKMTFIAASHHDLFIQSANRVVKMVDGAVVEDVIQS